MAPHVGRQVLALRFIQKTILAPTAIGLAVYCLASRFGMTHKPLLVVCSVIVGWPIKFSLGVRYESWRRTRRARALGAVPASESRGKFFGDIDAIQEIQEVDKNGFIGEFLFGGCASHPSRSPDTAFRLIGEWFAAQHEKAGSGTFAAAFLGEYFISTSDPGNIKAILATGFNNFEKGKLNRVLMGRSLTVYSIRLFLSGIHGISTRRRRFQC